LWDVANAAEERSNVLQVKVTHMFFVTKGSSLEEKVTLAVLLWRINECFRSVELQMMRARSVMNASGRVHVAQDAGNKCHF